MKLCMSALVGLSVGFVVLSAAQGQSFEKTFTLKDSIGRTWTNELIHYQVSFSAGKAWRAGVRLTDQQGRSAPVQLTEAVENANGSVARANMWLLANVPANGSVAYTLHGGRKGNVAAKYDTDLALRLTESEPGRAPRTRTAKLVTSPKGLRKLDAFDYRGVTLDGGRLRWQLDEVRDYYLRIPNDDLLKGFRQRAKMPAPGKDLGGWYSSDTFHVFGQILSGLARLYAATGDDACKEKVDALVSGWGQCIAADGYFYYSVKPNAPHYIYDKIVGGLVDAHLYCGNQEALGYLRRITDWAVKNLDRSRRTADTGTEWYTLSENLYRAYLATGDPVFRDFAEVWEYHEYWDIYARKADLFAPRPAASATTPTTPIAT